MTTQERLEQTIHSTDTVRLGEQVRLAFMLSLPAILSNLTNIIMDYIDTAMVGSLGANATASIGLVATSTWLLGGICSAMVSGFSVQVAHLFGADKKAEANDVLRQAFFAALIFGTFLMIVSGSISLQLPIWLGGNEDIVGDAGLYFLVFAFATPTFITYVLIVSMLRCSGNMKVPSIVSVVICAMDVVFNFFMIFPTRPVELLGIHFTCPGFGLGVLGAAIGSLVAWMLGTIYLIYYICRVSKELRLSFIGRWLPTERVLKKALKIGSPIGLERIISCAAQITSTVIVAPLGTVAIAANAMGIIIESLCYMPGYGIGEAATTLIGQSVGAKRQDLIRRFALITLMLGVGIMSLLAVVMYITAPDIMTLMTPDIDVQQLTTRILRIEAFAEPLFATSIICYGIFVGMGDTFIPSLMQLGSIWLIRIPFAALVAAQWGLTGVWIAMAAELSVRGVVMLIRLIKKIKKS
ncbi:MAG: MATE family efflux transporter [Bacteroidaceae bacterium]|nr:MATE family efflux transporter [Bacteroidaceae bacterium]